MKFFAFSLLVTLNVCAQAQIKVYVLDGGILEGVNPERFGLKREEVTTTRLPCAMLPYCPSKRYAYVGWWSCTRFGLEV
jgi:hypothetical protein